MIKVKSDFWTTVYPASKTDSIIILIKVYDFPSRRHQIYEYPSPRHQKYATEDTMAPSAVPFEPSYAALTNLRHKIHKHTTSVNLTLPIRPSDLSTDSSPYLDGAIGILSDSTALLYDDDAPWAVKVIEVKKAVDRVNIKVNKVKTEVMEIKIEVAEIKTEVAEIKTEVAEIKTKVTELKIEMNDIKTAINNGIVTQLNRLQKWLDNPI